jgi:hypothetical protein
MHREGSEEFRINGAGPHFQTQFSFVLFVSANNEGIKLYLANLYSGTIHFCSAFASDYDTKCLKVIQPIELWFRRRKVEITTYIYIYILLFLLP